MISKKDILKMVRRVTHRSSGYTERTPINPQREWCFGLIILAITIIAGEVCNVIDYKEYSTLETTVMETTAPVKKYDARSAATAKKLYEQKAFAFNRLANDAPNFLEINPEEFETENQGMVEGDAGDEPDPSQLRVE